MNLSQGELKQQEQICPRCGTKMDNYCPKCGYPLNVDSQVADSVTAPDMNQNKSLMKPIIGILLFIFIICCLFLAFGHKSDTPVIDNHNTQLRVMAEQTVEDYLKSPSSAKYSSDDNDWSVSKDGNIISIRSYVDSQNSFGAMLRSNFLVKIDWDGKSNTFYKEYTEIDGKVYRNLLSSSATSK
jgi:hypothetical protein